MLSPSPFSVAALLLLESDRVRCGKAPCRPLPYRRSSNDGSIADSGFYSESETGSCHSLMLEPCRATADMVGLAKNLFLFCFERKVSIDDQVVDIRTQIATNSPVLDTFISSYGVTNVNSWGICDLAARHVLKTFPNDRTCGSCALESAVEVYLSLILAMTSSPSESIAYVDRARKLCRKQTGEMSEHVRAVERTTLALTPATLEHISYRPARLRRDTCSSVRSSSSFVSTFSMSSTTSSKSSRVPAGILKDTEVLGSFAVTPPAQQSLRAVLARSKLRRLPFLWLLNTKPVAQAEEIGKDDDLPTISRTPSNCSFADSATSSEGPQTPNLPPTILELCESPTDESSSPSTLIPALAKRSSSEMNHILARVERASKFRTTSGCSTCGTIGSDYPKCPRCAEMWCSRECRLKGGKRHVCVM